MHVYLRQKANRHLGWYLYESVWLTTNAGQLPGHYLENVCGVFLEVSVWTVDWWARALSSPESPSRSQRLTPQHWRTHLAAVSLQHSNASFLWYPATPKSSSLLQEIWPHCEPWEFVIYWKNLFLVVVCLNPSTHF